MKKRLICIALLMVVVGTGAIFGFAEIPMLNENNNSSKETKTVETSNTQISSDEDMVLKTKIAEISDTKVDFRFKKQQLFSGKNYDLAFSRIGCITSEDITSNITYKTETGDEVSYDLETGRLTMANFPSLATEKSTQSIDVIAAEEIAYNYAAANCDIDKYILDSKEERDNGYMFVYCKYIFGYRTNDKVRVLVGFDGTVISATIRFYAIDDEKISVDKTWFETQIEELEEKHQKILIEDIWIDRDQHSDKIYFNIKCKTFDEHENVSASIIRIEIK